MLGEMQDIEVITRAFIMKDDKILLAHAKGAYNTFLPGGHIEKGEFARDALERELLEELGVNSRVGDFLGLLEYFYWLNDDSEVQEINVIFSAELGNYDVTSKEGKLEFIWVNKEELKTANLLPEPLPILLHNWMQTQKSFYHSTVESIKTRNAVKNTNNIQ